MADLPEYPLKQVLMIKKDRVEKAEKVFKEKKLALEKEQEKLKVVTAQRDEVLDHYNAKLNQIRQSFDEGTTSPEIQQMKAYLKVVKEKLKKEEAKVKEQLESVKTAENNLDIAKQDLNRKRIDAQKMEMHQDEWTKEASLELNRKEIAEHDEIGTVTHQAHKKKMKNLEGKK